MNRSAVCLPPDEFERGETIDSDMAADYLELSAFFFSGRKVSVHIITDALETVQLQPRPEGLPTVRAGPGRPEPAQAHGPRAATTGAETARRER